MTYNFDTGDNIPYNVIEALADKFKNLRIKWRYASENYGHMTGGYLLKEIKSYRKSIRKEVNTPYCTPCGAGANCKMKKIICNILESLVLLWGAIFVLPTFLLSKSIVKVLGFFVDTAIKLLKKTNK